MITKKNFCEVTLRLSTASESSTKTLAAPCSVTKNIIKGICKTTKSIPNKNNINNASRKSKRHKDNKKISKIRKCVLTFHIFLFITVIHEN